MQNHLLKKAKLALLCSSLVLFTACGGGGGGGGTTTNKAPTVTKPKTERKLELNDAKTPIVLGGYFDDAEDNDAQLKYNLVSNSKPDVLEATIDNSTLNLKPKKEGSSTLRFTATDTGGKTSGVAELVVTVSKSAQPAPSQGLQILTEADKSTCAAAIKVDDVCTVTISLNGIKEDQRWYGFEFEYKFVNNAFALVAGLQGSTEFTKGFVISGGTKKVAALDPNLSGLVGNGELVILKLKRIKDGDDTLVLENAELTISIDANATDKVLPISGAESSTVFKP